MSKVEVLSEVTKFLQAGHSHFINGRLIKGTGKTTSVENPANLETVANFNQGTEQELDYAIQSAHKAFNGVWGDTSPAQRQDLLNKFASLIDENAEQLAQIEVLCTGKNINIARFEMQQSAVFVRYYAGWATKISGETLQPSLPSMAGEKYFGLTVREPIGVVGAIIPWNFPVMIAIWKLAAALTCGCTFVAKPSGFTPFSLLLLAKLAKDAGIADGVFNVVNGEGGKIGQGLINHPLVNKVSFTGSVPIGLKVGEAAAKANLTRFTLELGGKNPAGFCKDIPVDEIVKGILDSSMVHQGQICASIERVYIHSSVIDQVVKALPAALSNFKLGCPFDETAHFGPLSNKLHYEKILEFFERAKASGETIVYGAHSVKELAGYYVPPTVLLAKDKNSPFLKEETFGPVVTLCAYDDEQEMVDLMNDTPYGLTASIWTKDLSKAVRMTSQVKAGIVWVNMCLSLDPSVPFGGVKSSGVGREFGSAFIEDYTELKSVIMKV